MNPRLILLGIVVLILEAFAAQCPSTGQIYTQGVTAQGKTDVIAEHNNYRNMIMTGKVPGQPKGVGLNILSWDNSIANEARKVSNTCKMEHIIGTDSRFYVGQNLYISWSSVKSTNQDWKAAVKAWYNEYVNYQYPTGSKNGQVVGHYTQVVWGDTKYLGCDFIAFEDKNQPSYPHAKLYTCNYGPGGNYVGRAPYTKA